MLTSSQREELLRLYRRAEFYRTLSKKLTEEIAKTRKQLDEMYPDQEPTIEHFEIDDELQTGDSRLLGGAMRIQAPHGKNIE
jgi:hypothetical protein